MSDAGDGIARKRANDVTQSINDFVQRRKNLVAKAAFADFFPDLLNGIHFGSSRRKEEQSDIVRNNKSVRFMPGCPIANKKDIILGILF